MTYAQLPGREVDGARAAPPGWAYPHPPRGTCVPSCPAHGQCHCGCGGSPKTSQVTSAGWHRVAGRPFTFVSGHQMRIAHQRAGMWSRRGVPVERVRPFLLWLRQRHGSMRSVAALLDMPEPTVRGYVYNTKRKRVPPEAAKRIADLVLAHRTSLASFSNWEEEPGLRFDVNERRRQA